ncbi:hypothetical protein L9F63_017445, partial [Diploptera punctata]
HVQLERDYLPHYHSPEHVLSGCEDVHDERSVRRTRVRRTGTTLVLFSRHTSLSFFMSKFSILLFPQFDARDHTSNRRGKRLAEHFCKQKHLTIRIWST